MTMIERMENAIRAVLASRFGITICDDEPSLGRTALEAMLEPTEAMFDAGFRFGCDCRGDDEWARSKLKTAWQAMIEEALKQ